MKNAAYPVWAAALGLAGDVATPSVDLKWRRRFGTVAGVFCALCLQPATLCDSHVVPEFLYRPAYDEKHRITSVHPGQQPRFIQKGVREPLLCASCESHLNTSYEQPMSALWEEMIAADIAGSTHSLKVPEYRTFKLFHLSIFWRASVARRDEWKDVSLGPTHEGRLRSMLLERVAPAPRDYALLGNVFLFDGAPCFGVVGAHTTARTGAARVCALTYGGCTWYIVVASHPVVRDGNPYVLSDAGRLAMRVHPFEHLGATDSGPQVYWRGPSG